MVEIEKNQISNSKIKKQKTLTSMKELVENPEIEKKAKVVIFKILLKSTLEVVSEYHKNNKHDNHDHPFKDKEYQNKKKEIENSFNLDVAYSIYKKLKLLNLSKTVIIVAFMYVDILISQNVELIRKDFLKK